LIFALLLLSLVLAACQPKAPLQEEGKQTAVQKTSITPTEISTATPTSTLTPEPTTTPVPPTPTIDPPAIVIEFLGGVEILNIDRFDNLSNWNTWNSGTGSIVDGMFELTGQEGWSSGLVLSRKLKEGDGVILRFKTVNNATFKSEFVFSTGAWQTDSFRQFGVYNGKYPKADLFQGKIGLGYNNLFGNLTMKADTWYKLLMAVGEGGEFLAVVWLPDNPSRMVFYNENIGEKWEDKKWEFIAKATKGETVYIDDFSSISFSSIK
jgi:hypothetical protein